MCVRKQSTYQTNHVPFSNFYSDPEQTEHSDNEVHMNEHEDIENIIELDGIEKEIRSKTNEVKRPAFNFWCIVEQMLPL